MFNPGDMVVCVNKPEGSMLKVGKVYTIAEYYLNGEGMPYVKVKEIRISHSYMPSRFTLNKPCLENK